MLQSLDQERRDNEEGSSGGTQIMLERGNRKDLMSGLQGWWR